MRSAVLLAMAASAVVAQIIPPATQPGRGVTKAAAPPARKSAPASAPIGSYKDLKFAELGPIHPPQMESVTLPNGLRVFLLEDHDLPVVNGLVMVKTGTLLDPNDKLGLSTLTQQLLLSGGTTNQPDGDVSRRLQALGAEVDGVVNENSAAISLFVLQENADKALDVLHDAVTAPALQQERIDLMKSRLRTAIGHRNDDPAIVLRREFSATVYGKSTPYGVQPEYATVDRINRGDVVSFYQRYYFPKNTILALRGDFDSARMKSKITALFDDWKSEQQPVSDFPRASTAGTPGSFLAVRTDNSLAYMSIGQLSSDFLDKDYPALQIMTAILGDGPRSRIKMRLQESGDVLTATWGAAFGHPGLFRVSGYVNAFRLPRAVKMVNDEIARLRTAEVTDEELKAAKDAALNSLVFEYDNQFAMLPRLVQNEYFNFPKDYIQNLQKGLETVTRADVLRVAKERLDPARMTTVVVANPTGFEVPLESLGVRVTSIDLTIPPPKPEAVDGDTATQRRGVQLLTKAQEAMGGADKLAAVTDYVAESSYQFDPSAGGEKATMTERWMAPGYLRQDSVLVAGKLSVYCDGKGGWISASGTTTSLSGTQLKQVQGDLFRVLFNLMLSDKAKGRKLNGIDANTVEVADGGQIVKLVFDPATGLLDKVLYDAVIENGQASVIESYSDYRTVGGLKVPYKIAITLSGQKYQDIGIKSFQLNTGLRQQDLEKRP